MKLELRLHQSSLRALLTFKPPRHARFLLFPKTQQLQYRSVLTNQHTMVVTLDSSGCSDWSLSCAPYSLLLHPVRTYGVDRHGSIDTTDRLRRQRQRRSTRVYGSFERTDWNTVRLVRLT